MKLKLLLMSVFLMGANAFADQHTTGPCTGDPNNVALGAKLVQNCNAYYVIQGMKASNLSQEDQQELLDAEYPELDIDLSLGDQACCNRATN